MLERFRGNKPAVANPFRELLNFQEEINKLFDDFFRAPKAFDEDVVFAPDIDIAETKESFIIKADLPGMTEKDIEVTLTNNVLTIKGERKEEKEEKEKNYYRKERIFGTFVREIQIPKKILQDKVKAKFKNGVLEIELPKAEEEKEKSVKIEVEK
ncbi:Hsp20/alpha crystallin family protein [Deferribacter thermophilus]|uniref:Hsp20/alpha crystallin family protein n=1 Tax=Deferribacter thermophilus TaxID=53573 RepID=UPI003C1F8B1B